MPIQAMVVREMIVDEQGQHRPAAARRQAEARASRRPSSAQELPAGQKRKELEGVFVVKDGAAEFLPVKTGIAGDKLLRGAVGAEGRRPGDHRARSTRCATSRTATRSSSQKKADRRSRRQR